ncbi:MAG: DNA topoisomerase IV, partial [Promicromonosporaceae bacterium]|nr:DNA topoisomerase IV [Promicromonosporaceae bacterium]
KFSTLELEAELAELQKQIAELQEILSNKEKLNEVVSGEMGEVAAQFGTPRRTILVDEAGMPTSQSTTINLFGGTEPSPGANQAGSSSSSSRRSKASLNLEIADTPTKVVLSATGLLARVPLGANGTPSDANGDQESPPRPRISPPRGHHDAVKSEIATTTRSEVGLITSNGRMIKMPVVELPALPGAGNALAGGASATDVVELARGETVVGVASLAPDAPTLALGTAGGVVKRVTQGDQPNNKDEWEVIALKEGDHVVGIAEVNDDDELVFISSDSSLLHYLASAVRPQGRAAGGMAGISLGAGAQVIFFGAAPAALRPDLVVATVAGSSGQLIKGGSSVKVTPYEYYPSKGRATGGVRSMRFLKGEDRLVLAWVGENPARAVTEAGTPVALPELDRRRDGSGSPVSGQIAAIG